MDGTSKWRSTVSRVGRMAALVLGTLTVAYALGACGGAQTPPAEGQCHEWREWVPPEKQANGDWREGYCRNARER